VKRKTDYQKGWTYKEIRERIKAHGSAGGRGEEGKEREGKKIKMTAVRVKGISNGGGGGGGGGVGSGGKKKQRGMSRGRSGREMEGRGKGGTRKYLLRG